MARLKEESSTFFVVTIVLACFVWSTNSSEPRMGVATQNNNNNKNGNEMKENEDKQILVEQQNSESVPHNSGNFESKSNQFWNLAALQSLPTTTNSISSLTGHGDSLYVDTRDSSRHLQSSREPSEVKFIEASNVQTAKSGQWLNNKINLFSSSKEPDDLTTQMSVKNLPKFYLNQQNRIEKNIKSNDESRTSTHSHLENKKLVAASEVNNLKESSAALISFNKIEGLSNDEFINSQKTGAIASTTNTHIKDNELSSISSSSRKNKDTNINIKLNSVNNNPLTKSHFDTNVKSLYKTNIGSTAILSCVLSSANTLSRVSWLRGEEILSSGNITVSGDARYQVKHVEGSRNWQLEIPEIQLEDEGYYTCQVNTIPVASLSVYLRVTNASISIDGNKSVVNFDLGQPISLTCIVDLDTQPANSSNVVNDTDDSVKQLYSKSLFIENDTHETGSHKHHQMKRSTKLVSSLPRHLKSLLEVSQKVKHRDTNRKKDISFNINNNDDDEDEERHFIYWFRNNISLSFASTSNKDPRITIQDSTIGSKLISHLTIDESKYSDIGKYECKIITLNLKPANINVLVSNESSDPSSSASKTPLELSIVTLIWLNLLSYLLKHKAIDL